MRRALGLDDFLADIGLFRFQVDDMPVGPRDAGSFDEAALHVAVHFQVPEQEELRIVARLRGIQRGAQGLAWLGGAHQVRRDQYAWHPPMLVQLT